MMAPIFKLPDELLVDIVERVEATSKSSIPNLSLSCKTLHRLCRPFQWTHVVLPWRLSKNASIARFLEAHSGNTSIRTLRLVPQRGILTAFLVKMKNASDHLDALCDCLNSLTKLTTFSICLDGRFQDIEIDSRCHLPSSVLSRIVRALPPSLVRLELDVSKVDRMWEDKLHTSAEAHLCLAISERVPYLENLWLRASCLCTELFRSLKTVDGAPQVTSKLRRTVIRLDTGEDLGGVSLPEDCRDCEDPRHIDPKLHRTRASLKTRKLATHLLNLQSGGAFPQAQRFMVFSWRSDFEFGGRYCHVWDIATRSVTRFPKIITHLPGYLHCGELNYRDQIYLIRDHEKENWIGDRSKIQVALFHEVSWKETCEGTRVPLTGELKDKGFHLCGRGLLSLGYLQGLEEEERRAGRVEAGVSRLPKMEGMERACVVIDEV